MLIVLFASSPSLSTSSSASSRSSKSFTLLNDDYHPHSIHNEIHGELLFSFGPFLSYRESSKGWEKLKQTIVRSVHWAEDDEDILEKNHWRKILSFSHWYDLSREPACFSRRDLSNAATREREKKRWYDQIDQKRFFHVNVFSRFPFHHKFRRWHWGDI